jgi:hypothetical protein
MRLRRLPVVVVHLCLSLWIALPALAKTLLDDSFEPYRFSPSDVDRDPGNPGDGDPYGWFIAALDRTDPATVQVVSGSSTDGDAPNAQVLHVAYQNAPAAQSFHRLFTTYDSTQDPPILRASFKIRFHDVTSDTHLIFYLVGPGAASGSAPLAVIRMRPATRTGSQAGFSVRSSSDGPGAGSLIDQSLVPQIEPDQWYQVAVTADLYTQRLDVAITNLDDADAAQSGSLAQLWIHSDASQASWISWNEFGASHTADYDLDDVRVETQSVRDELPDGDFEQDFVGGLPDGWSLSKGDSSDITQQTDAPSSGQRYIRFDASGHQVGLQLASDLPLEAGSLYRLGFDYRVLGAAAGTAAYLQVLCSGPPSGDPLVNAQALGTSADAAWQSAQVAFVDPPGCVHPDINLASWSSFRGVVDLDRAQLVRLSQARLEAPASTRAYQFVAAGAPAATGFVAVPPDRSLAGSGDYGWDVAAGGRIPSGNYSVYSKGYPTTLQAVGVRRETFVAGQLPPGDYRVTVYVGGIWRSGVTDLNHHVTANGVDLIDESASRDELMDTRYFGFTDATLVTRDDVERGGAAIYDRYIAPRFRDVRATVSVGSDGKLSVQALSGYMDAVVITPVVDGAAHDAAIADLDQQLEDEFVGHWAQLLPTPSLWGARKGTFTPSQTVGYVLFRRPWMEKVEYDSRPDASEVFEPGTDELQLHATPGEYEPATISIWPLQDLEDVKVSLAGDLSGPDGVVLPASAVRVWYLQQRPVRRAEPATGYYLIGTFLPDWGASRDLYKGMVQRVWLNVKVPGDAPAGTYTGALQINADGLPSTSVTLKVSVYPFTLERPVEHNVMRSWSLTLEPYPSSYAPGQYDRMTFESDGRNKQYYHKLAVDDVYAHGFAPEVSDSWNRDFDRARGVMNWDANDSLIGPMRQLLDLIADSPFGAGNWIWVDASSIRASVLDAFDTGPSWSSSPWTEQDVGAWLTMLHRDLGTGHQQEFGGYSKLYLHTTAEENKEEPAGSFRWNAWLAYLDFVRNGDPAAGIDPSAWGNDPAHPADDNIVTVHTLNTVPGHKAVVPTGKVDRPYLGMFHGVDGIGAAQQVADAQAAGQPFGIYGLRGRFEIGYYRWAAGASAGLFHEFYGPYYGIPDDDWDDPLGIDASSGRVTVEAPTRINVIPSPERMVGSWFWEEAREGLDDEAYLDTLEDWVARTADSQAPAVTTLRATAQNVLAYLHARIDLDVDPTKLLSPGPVATGYLYRPIDLTTFDPWRQVVASVVASLKTVYGDATLVDETMEQYPIEVGGDNDPGGADWYIAEPSPDVIQVAPGSSTTGRGANAQVLHVKQSAATTRGVLARRYFTRQTGSIVHTSVKLRVNDVTAPSDYVIWLADDSGGFTDAWKVRVRSSVTSSGQAGIYATSGNGGPGGTPLLSRSLVRVVEAGCWYRIDVTADLARRTFHVSVTNLDDGAPGQSGSVTGLWLDHDLAAADLWMINNALAGQNAGTSIVDLDLDDLTIESE